MDFAGNEFTPPLRIHFIHSCVERSRRRRRNMGKATFYRKQKLGCVNYLVVFLPLIGGTLFLVGSLFFWPGFGIYQHELRHLGPDGRPILAEHAEDMGNSTTTHRLCLFYSRYFDENHTFRLEHDQCAELMEWIGALAFLLLSLIHI